MFNETVFELNVVYTQNQTYRPSDVLTVVIAVQNPSKAATIGAFCVDCSFQIMAKQNGLSIYTRGA
jgi:hypothetical protein